MPEPPQQNRLFAAALFVASAAFAAFALRIAWREPVAAAVGVAVAAVIALTRWLSRRRAVALLKSGDVHGVLGRWSGALSRSPHAETMGPLMAATAFAAFGWIDRAREILRSAARGPAWEAAIEHRLFLDALLLTFEGDPSSALDRADRLMRLPMPTEAPALARRVHILRGAVAALARAFAHSGRQGDRGLLIEASDASPLVHWAMRYGAAILAIDDGDLAQASALISGAPAWPRESCFARFHHEIAAEIATRLA